MQENFTPIPSEFISEPRVNDRTTNKAIIITGVFFLLSLGFFLTTYISGTTQKPTLQVSKNAGLKDRAKKIVIKILGKEYKFNSIDDIKFIPGRVGEYLIDAEILNQAKSKYEGLDGLELKKEILREIIGWAALRDFFSQNNTQGVVLNPINQGQYVSWTDIDSEFASLLTEYNKNQISVDGFFMKVRFEGIFPKNLETLRSGENDPKFNAQALITKYLDEAKKLPSPVKILDTFNADDTIMLMNNGEKAQTFSSYNLYPPLFDDPSFFDYILNTPIGSFSPLYTLKTKNPFKDGFEEYAFATFYVDKKSGQNLPLEILIHKFIQKSVIR